MKVFIGGELEHSISDKFRKARNSVIEYMDCLCDISSKVFATSYFSIVCE